MVGTVRTAYYKTCYLCAISGGCWWCVCVFRFRISLRGRSFFVPSVSPLITPLYEHVYGHRGAGSGRGFRATPSTARGEAGVPLFGDTRQVGLVLPFAVGPWFLARTDARKWC